MVVFVEIIGVGTGNDNTIGMTGGDLLWSSSIATGFHVGFFDEKTLNGVAASCNIAYGGTLGGFDGDVVLSVYSAELISALIAKTIDLIGKEFRVSICDDPDEYASRVRRYTGRVGTWSTRNEISIDIVCRPYTEFNKKVIPSVTITDEIALGLVDSTSIGKSVTESYGNICLFPMTYLEGAKSYNPLLAFNNPAGGGIVDANAPRLDGLGEGFNSIGELVGKSAYQILGVYQDGSDYVWIMLSHNGRPLFTVDAESELPTLKRAFIGSVFSVIEGTGKNSSYKVLDIRWDSHSAGSVTHEGVWFQINTVEATDIKGAGGYIDTFGTSDANRPLSPFRSSSLVGDYRITADSRFIAPFTTDEGMLNGISTVVLSNSNNLYVVSSKANLTDCSIVSGDSSVTIPTDGIEIIYEGPIYKIIRVLLSQGVLDEDSSFNVLNISQVRTRFYETDTLGAMANDAAYVWFPSSVYLEGVADGTEISTPYTYTLSRDVALSTAVPTYCVTTTRLDLSDIEINADSIVIIPDIKFEFDFDFAMLGDAYFDVELIVIGEGNLVIGSKLFKTELNQLGVSGDATLWIRPDLQEVWLVAIGASDYTSPSKPLFKAMMESLDIADIIKGYGNKARYVLVKTSLVIERNGDGTSRTRTITKTVGKLWTGSLVKLDKDKLYLKSESTSVYTANSPATLARQIALENGLSIVAGTFASVDTTMRTFFDTAIELFDGQYQPSNDTTVVKALHEIAQASMMALYMNPSGQVIAKWFADDDMDTAVDYSFNGNKVVKGSMQITKPQNGYRFTDFVFDIIKRIGDSVQSVFVNTDPTELVDDFPSDGVRSSGEIISSGTGWELSCYTPSGYTLVVRAKVDLTEQHPITKFTEGMILLVSSTEDGDRLMRVTAVAYNFFEASKLSVDICLYALDDSTPDYDYDTVDYLQIMNPTTDWKDYVSGTFITDHTTARNIWEHAQEARLALGAESTMPNGTTRMTNPVWGSDTRALMQWVLYTVLYCTREKTIIKFDTELNSDTSSLWIMSYVEFAWGPYALYPIKGWIVDIQDNYAQGTVSITILTSVSDSDVLVLDEMALAPDLIVDESINTVSHDYDEGRLA